MKPETGEQPEDRRRRELTTTKRVSNLISPVFTTPSKRNLASMQEESSQTLVTPPGTNHGGSSFSGRNEFLDFLSPETSPTLKRADNQAKTNHGDDDHYANVIHILESSGIHVPETTKVLLSKECNMYTNKVKDLTQRYVHGSSSGVSRV
jgi:hypothetical protein